jgi:hypothetical protein
MRDYLNVITFSNYYGWAIKCHVIIFFFFGPFEDHCVQDIFASQKEKPTLVDN